VNGTVRTLVAAVPCCAALLTGAALAEVPFVTEDAFRDWTEGRVIQTDRIDGMTFGIEEFGRDGQVVWREPDGTCLTGRWRAEGGSICYHYDGIETPSCLRYQTEGDSLIGYQWDNAAGPLGYLGLTLRLTPTDKLQLGCQVAPLS
jgi:hypothetical protein